MQKLALTFFGFFLVLWQGYGQGITGGKVSGGLQTNLNFFMKDASINAANTPQYETQLYSADSWLNVNYNTKGFEAGIRLDVYNHSYLFNPNGGSYTGIGIGNWYVAKQIDKLNVAGGYLYDQIGSGIIYRAYEERPLAIDNALFGVRASYDLTPNWRVKGFTGQQKFQFDRYGAIIKGASIDGFITVSDSAAKHTLTLSPGAGVVARTFDNPTIEGINNVLKYYEPIDSIATYKSNTYAMTVYNTLSYGPFTLYTEAAYKTPEVMYSPTEFRHIGLDSSAGKFIKAAGTVFYGSLSYADHGLGINIEGKRTKNFSFRTDPNLLLNRGLINYIPAMSRVNTYRLTSRYNPAIQFMGEYAFQVDVQYRFNDHWNALINYSHINDLNDVKLYREIYGEVTFKPNKKNQFILGLQRQEYNQYIYEGKVGAPNVETFTPYIEYLHKFNRKTAIRVEGSMMATRQDYGSWAFGLVELTIAPHWSFVIADMYNYDYNPEKTKKANNYPSIIAFYTRGSNRFSLGYIKQVEGIVCTGGICRYEPAFSGVKATVSTTF